jgi:hypothetical protein
MRRPILLAALVAVSAAPLTPLAAQRPSRDRGIVELAPEPTRGGFYATLGVGAGREQYKFSDENEYTDALTKPTLALRLGGTPNANVRVGAELFGWGSEVEEGTESFTAALLSAQVYPSQTAGFYLKGGGGIARSGIDFNNGSSTFETGFGWTVGAGYDLPLSRAVAIGPTLDFYQGSFTQRNEPTLTERVLNIGVQVTFQTGRRGR